jgi:hypothetical protein
LLLPGLYAGGDRVRQQARETAGRGNLRQLGAAMAMDKQNHDGRRGGLAFTLGILLVK